MSYFYILFCITLLLLSKYALKIRLLLLSIISYVGYVNFSGFYNVEEYITVSVLFMIIINNILFDSKEKLKSISEILSINIFKIIDIILLLYPTTYLILLQDYYFYLDDLFISSLLFVIFSREVGYHPFKMDKSNLRKYILTAVVSYLTLIFIF